MTSCLTQFNLHICFINIGTRQFLPPQFLASISFWKKKIIKGFIASILSRFHQTEFLCILFLEYIFRIIIFRIYFLIKIGNMKTPTRTIPTRKTPTKENSYPG